MDAVVWFVVRFVVSSSATVAADTPGLDDNVTGVTDCPKTVLVCLKVVQLGAAIRTSRIQQFFACVC